MTQPIGIASNHTAAGDAIRARLKTCLDIESIGDGAALDRANDDGHPDNQAVYVEFAGEYSSFDPGADHIWHVWLVQRRDYPDWEMRYGCLRASLVCALDGWQPGSDVKDMTLLRDRCGVEDYPGLRVDLTAWRIAELTFV